MLGAPDELPELVEQLGVERVMSRSRRSHDERTLELVRSLKDYDVQIDVVPRLFEIDRARASACTRSRACRSSAFRPRGSRARRSSSSAGSTCVGASILLVLPSPLFAFIAWRIKRDSPGPVFFRQSASA